MIQLRCAAKLHGIILEPGSGILEVACESRFCGKSEGVAIRHQFDISTGSLLATQQFRDPALRRRKRGR